MKGHVILFRTGEDADAMAFTPAEYNWSVAARRPDEAEGSDEDGEEIDSEEEEESDEEDREEEEAAALETLRRRMWELRISELRKAGKQCALDVKGGEHTLLTRL
eukprot:3935180-Rhodomonas_salina.1